MQNICYATPVKGSWPTGWESLFYSKTESIRSLFSATSRDSPVYRHVPLTQVFSSIVRIHQGERLSLLQGVLLPRVQNCLTYWFNLCWGQYLNKERSKSQSQSRTSISGPSNIKSEGLKRLTYIQKFSQLNFLFILPLVLLLWFKFTYPLQNI